MRRGLRSMIRLVGDARRLIVIVAVSAMTLVGLVGGPASAVVPGANGRIVFSRAVCTSTCVWEIVAADPDDANETVLAGPYPQDAFDDAFIANWSPDGTSVIFMVNQGIWQVSADGAGLHELFHAPGDSGVDDGPAFTPDGKHIVFTRCCPRGFGYSLWMINSDGTGLKDLTVEARDRADTTPQVSPDGKRIVFNRCFPDRPCVVATVNINGSNIRQLTDNTLFGSEHPNWSPDSKTIVFTMQANGTADIATMNPDGTGLTQLTFNTAGRTFSFDPCFSPDGRKILFAHYPSTGGIDPYTMNPDGSGITHVTKTASLEFDPEWAVAS